MGSAITPALDALISKQSITEVLYRYCRGTDRGDEALLKSCFHEDSRHRSDSTHASGGFEGRSFDYVARILDICGQLAVCTHMVSNILVDISGDAAVSECRFLAHHGWYDDGDLTREHHRVVEGRYLDRFERRGGDWKISERVGVHEFSREFSILPSAGAALKARHSWPDDPVYGLLAALDGQRDRPSTGE